MYEPTWKSMIIEFYLNLQKIIKSISNQSYFLNDYLKFNKLKNLN